MVRLEHWMTGNDTITGFLAEGRVWEAGGALVGASERDIERAGGAFAEASGDTREVLDCIGDLVLPGEVPAGMDRRERLCREEAMRLVAAELALGLVEMNWRDFAGEVRALATGENSYRVREASVRVLTAIATCSFEESRGFFEEMLLDEEAFVVEAAMRALAASEAPVASVLELCEGLVGDMRKAVRNVFGPRILAELGRRDPQMVYMRLTEWAGRNDEMVRFNVAEALRTVLGGRYVEQSMEILGALAADERPMVWRAAADALVEVAQRNPAFVLPILGRWREDVKRFKCAEIVLKRLASH